MHGRSPSHQPMHQPSPHPDFADCHIARCWPAAPEPPRVSWRLLSLSGNDFRAVLIFATVVVCLSLGRRYIGQGAMQPVRIEPRHPFQGRQFDGGRAKVGADGTACAHRVDRSLAAYARTSSLPLRAMSPVSQPNFGWRVASCLRNSESACRCVFVSAAGSATAAAP